MKVTMAGAKISDAIVEVIDTLQNFSELRDCYLRAIDELTRIVILNNDDINEDGSTAMERLHTLQLIRQDIVTLSTISPDPDSEVSTEIDNASE